MNNFQFIAPLYIMPNGLKNQRKYMVAYKYRGLRDLKRFLDIIVNKRLYGTTYLNLNDPLEGQFNFDLSRMEHSDVQRLFDERATAIICSLSKSSNSKGIPNKGIMWSMYADEHRGCCIAVEVDDNDWKEVNIYYSELGQIITDPNTRVIDILSIKSKQWAYEEEVRYINTSNQSHYLNVKIKAVYFGIRVSDEDVDFYKKLIQAIDPNIEVVKLKRNEINWYR